MYLTAGKFLHPHITADSLYFQFLAVALPKVYISADCLHR